MSREPRRENACAGQARGDGPLMLDVLCEQMAEFLSLGLQVALVSPSIAYPDGGSRAIRLRCTVIADASKVQRFFLAPLAVDAAQRARSAV